MIILWTKQGNSRRLSRVYLLHMTPTPLSENTIENTTTSERSVLEKQKRLHRYFYTFLFVFGAGIILFLLYINGQSIYERGI